MPLPAGRPDARRNPRAATATWLHARLSPHTRRAYAGDLSDYLTWLDAHGLDPLQVSRRDVDDYLTALRERAPAPGPATINRRISTLSNWYSHLIDADVAESNPIVAVDRMPMDRDSSPASRLSVAEVRALCRAADAEKKMNARRNRALIGVLAHLGLRVGEAIALDVTHLRRQDGHRVLTVHGKGGRGRELPMPASLARAVDIYLLDAPVGCRARWAGRTSRSPWRCPAPSSATFSTYTSTGSTRGSPRHPRSL